MSKRATIQRERYKAREKRGLGQTLGFVAADHPGTFADASKSMSATVVHVSFPQENRPRMKNVRRDASRRAYRRKQ